MKGAPTIKENLNITDISNIIKKLSGDLSENIIKRRKKIDKSIKGREEDITAQLEISLSDLLNHEIETKLNAYSEEIEIQFEVYAFKKTDEKFIGADLCGILDFNHNGQRIVKYFIAQSKICEQKTIKKTKFYKGGDSRLLTQTNNMLNRTSDSFVFIYSDDGIFVTPAYGVKLANGKIDTRTQYYRAIGDFYAEFFKCFIGDNKVNGRNLSELNLEEIIELVKSRYIHYIEIHTQSTVKE